MSQSTRPRMSKARRREQLLDAAATLVVSGGSTAITMEGLAEAAGVSKALPYAHFENSADVLRELHRREVDQLGARVIAAMEPVAIGEERLVVAIRTYFAVVAERGAIFSVVAAAAASDDQDDDIGPDFVGGILAENFGFSAARSARLGELVLGVLAAATARWSRGAASRRTVEADSIGFIVGAVRGLSADAHGA